MRQIKPRFNAASPVDPVRRHIAGFIGFGLCLLSTIGPAQAQPDCSAIKSLINHAAGPLKTSSAAPIPQGADQCASAIGEGGTNIHYCSWTFPFRSGEARQLFTNLNEQIGLCLNIGPNHESDQPVNHPDSFWLNTYRLETTKLSISVKDKSSLGKSLLFLRVQSLARSGG